MNVKIILDKLLQGVQDKKNSTQYGISDNISSDSTASITTNSDLTSMFTPKSIAVIGASTNEKKLGSIVLKNIIESGFGGEVFPLNLQASVIQGLESYKKYEDLPTIPDLALIAIPAKFVPDLLQEIANKGTKNIVIFSAGFKETGLRGLALENQIKEIAKAHKLNILGPNCLGFVNNLVPINAGFGQLVKHKGNLRFISQSGAIATSIFDWANCNKIGFSEFVTLGNKTDLNENDILQYFLDNELGMSAKGTSGLSPIGMYLESIINGKKFIEVARKISTKNPIFVLKPGKSIESKKAMQSHTGAIAGEDYVFDVALKKAGILRCDGIEDFFDLAKVFAWEKIPVGKNIAIVSNAGGPAVLSSDFVAEEGLNLVRFSEEVKKKLEENLPRAASIINPVDVLGDALAERYENAIKTLIVDENVHSLLIILTPQVMTQIEETAEVIGRLSLEYDKPIICSFMGGSHILKGEEVLNKYKIPSFRYPERAVKVISKMCEWSDFKNKVGGQVEAGNEAETIEKIGEKNEAVSKIISNALNIHRKTLDNFEANEILSSYGINTPPTKKCADTSDAKDFVSVNNFPVVLKTSSPEMLHKSDEGGVIVGIDSNEKLEEAFASLEKIRDGLGGDEDGLNSIQIQKQAGKGIELIIGSKKDPTFGNVIMFGAGGVLANLIEDRNLGLAPLNRVEIESMIKTSKVNKLLEGYRGEKGYEVNGIVDLILKLQMLVTENPEIQEVDINPAIINDNGIWAVDGKVVLS